jgi:hypothetical protein
MKAHGFCTSNAAVFAWAARYRTYAKARYHYAPTRNINTQFVTVAVVCGIEA